MNFREAVAYLDQHVNLEARAGRIEGLKLDSMRQLTDLLAEPQASFRSIHVTGTNGKGSVCHMASALLTATGLHVGTYTSPHVERLSERIRSNGELIPDDELAAAIADIARLEPLLDAPPSYFEILTAAAFSWFADHAVDVGVIEVGLLGRFDATNVIDADVAVVTSVGKDHTDGQGEWRRAVAREKAGIIKPESTLVLGETAPDLTSIFLAEGPARTLVRGVDFACVANKAAVGGRLVDIRTPHATYSDLLVPLHGSHQGDNVGIAVATVEALFDAALDEDLVRDGLRSVRLPGRFEIVHRRPLVVLDGAHNVDAAAALRRTIDESLPRGVRMLFVLGMLGPRDPDEVLAALGVGDAELVIACTPDSPRAIPGAELGRAAERLGAEVEVFADPGDAVARALALADGADAVVVTGTFYVLAAARAALARR